MIAHRGHIILSMWMRVVFLSGLVGRLVVVEVAGRKKPTMTQAEG